MFGVVGFFYCGGNYFYYYWCDIDVDVVFFNVWNNWVVGDI